MTTGRSLKYVAPNVVTCVGLVFGLLSIAASFRGDAIAAGWFIVMGVIVDKVDGTLARRLNASSAFGEQMDSLADLVTFGVAPAVMFLGHMNSLPGIVDGAPSWFSAYAYTCAFSFSVAGALRLARFNVMSSSYGHEYFFGTPVPMSGVLIALVLMIFDKYGVDPSWYRWVPVIYVLMAFTMVSNIPLPKVKPLRNPVANVFFVANIILVHLMGITWFLVPEEWLWPEYLLACLIVYFVVGATAAQLKGVRAPRA